MQAHPSRDWRIPLESFELHAAAELDRIDRFPALRHRFHLPLHSDGSEKVYLTGNSLGLQPKQAKQYILEELEDWANLGVEGHVHARRPWVEYHRFFSDSLARIVGAFPDEVVAMNGLTANLHLMMVSFYRPQAGRRKILCEAKAFPSDLYAFRSQIRFHGGQDEDLIALEARSGEYILRTDDILEAIERHRNELSLVLLGAVNYYTGQFFEIQKITSKAKEYGIAVGWDLAHAAGNVPMELHHWDVDFAAWCSYKYLNSGPGSVSGVFIHRKHHAEADLPRFEGWWGHRISDRFAMPDRFLGSGTAEAWQLSNAPVLSMAAHRASLDLFDEAKMENLREKSIRLTQYLEQLILESVHLKKRNWSIITPQDPEQRGAQLSLLIPEDGRRFFDYLTDRGAVVDWREPGVIRMAPAPLYNTFEDLARLYAMFVEYD